MGRKKKSESCQTASSKEKKRELTTNEICFNCFNATTNGCSWARNFTPVEGWEAEEKSINCGTGHYTTYHITACPEYTPDKPYGGKYQICDDGYMNLMKAFVSQCADEYRNAKEALEDAMRNENPEQVYYARERFKEISKYMEGYEKECERTVTKKDDATILSLDREELEKLYEDEVINAPDKYSKDKRIKLAKSTRKAAIISALYPCKKCTYRGGQFSKVCQACGFEHTRWKKMTPEQERHYAHNN